MFECNKPGCVNEVSAPPASANFSFASPSSLYCDEHLQELTAQGFFRSQPASEPIPIPVSEDE